VGHGTDPELLPHESIQDDAAVSAQQSLHEPKVDDPSGGF
jgi:hypothetical protein